MLPALSRRTRHLPEIADCTDLSCQTIPLARPGVRYRVYRSLTLYSHATLTALKILVASMLAGVVGIALDLDRPAWAVVSAMLVLQWGPDRRPGTIRGIRRLTGSVFGILPFAVFHSVGLTTWGCCSPWEGLPVLRGDHRRPQQLRPPPHRDHAPGDAHRWGDERAAGRGQSLAQYRGRHRRTLRDRWSTTVLPAGHGGPAQSAAGGRQYRGDGRPVRPAEGLRVHRADTGRTPRPAVRAAQRAPRLAVGRLLRAGVRGAALAPPSRHPAHRL